MILMICFLFCFVFLMAPSFQRYNSHQHHSWNICTYIDICYIYIDIWYIYIDICYTYIRLRLWRHDVASFTTLSQCINLHPYDRFISQKWRHLLDKCRLHKTNLWNQVAKLVFSKYYTSQRWVSVSIKITETTCRFSHVFPNGKNGSFN